MTTPLIRPFRLTIGETSFVSVLTDLPDAVSGVITLPGGTSWVLCGALDLMGSRIVCTGPVAFMGASPETCIVTSTGLTSQPIISSGYSLTLRDITITTPSGCTGVDLDSGASGAAVAVDWFAVNFSGPGRSVRLDTVDNAIMILCGWLGSDGILIEGTANTIAVTESIFTMSSGQAAVSFGSGAVINRRLRIESCAAPIATGATGFNVASTNIANPEAFILTRVNFSGSGTYLGSLTYLDDKVRFDECRGIVNSTRLGAMDWTGNATATTISATSTPVKVTATSTANALNQRFSHTSNRLTYTSAISLTFFVDVSASMESGNNNQCDLMIYKNGALVTGGITAATTSGSGRAEGVAAQCVVELDQSDYIEIWVQNNTATQNITVTDANIIVQVI